MKTSTLFSIFALTLLHPLTLTLAAPIASSSADNGVSPFYNSNGISPDEGSQLSSGPNSGLSSGGDSGNGNLGSDGGEVVAQPPSSSLPDDLLKALRELGERIGQFGQGEEWGVHLLLEKDDGDEHGGGEK